VKGELLGMDSHPPRFSKAFIHLAPVRSPKNSLHRPFTPPSCSLRWGPQNASFTRFFPFVVVPCRGSCMHETVPILVTTRLPPAPPTFPRAEVIIGILPPAPPQTQPDVGCANTAGQRHQHRGPGLPHLPSCVHHPPFNCLSIRGVFDPCLSPP